MVLNDFNNYKFINYNKMNNFISKGKLLRNTIDLLKPNKAFRLIINNFIIVHFTIIQSNMDYEQMVHL